MTKRESIASKIAILIGIVTVGAIFVYLFFGPQNPEIKTTLLDKTIETTAESMGIPLLEQKSLENTFVTGVTLGGAGGQGAPEIQSNTEQFIATLKENEKWPNLKTAYINYAIKTSYNPNGDNSVLKKYWLISASGITGVNEFKEFYPIPFNYNFKEANKQEIIFELDYVWDTIIKIVIFLGALILYFWLVYGRIKDIADEIIYRGENFYDKKTIT